MLDAVVAGGGLSGLSLVAHLATGGWADRKVLVVDGPATWPAAESWGFWSSEPGVLDAAVSRCYDRVRIHASGVPRVLPLDRYRYRVVHRADLSRVVRDLAGSCSGFRFTTGRVERVCDGEAAATVTVDGCAIPARWVFDSVSPLPAGAPQDARLAFTGWRVRCTRPVFDPDVPVLFDFRTAQGDGARFVYTLPDNPYRALVELTAYVPRHARTPSDSVRAEGLDRYLRDVLHSSDHEILHTESAVLPLRTRRPDRNGRRVLRVGAAAGLVKASTGYAYQRIQLDSVAVADSLVRCGNPFDLPRPRGRYRLLDAVLLDVLDRDPASLEQAFARFFSANPAERVLRFLDEDASARDLLRLIASLPPGPYLRALARRPWANAGR